MSNRHLKKLVVGSVLGVGLLASAGAAAAATSASVGKCTVSVNPVYVQYRGGVRGVEANVYVRCTEGRSGIVNAQMMEADTGSDDEITGLRSGSFTIPAGQTQKVMTVWGACGGNHDAVGAEEVYLKARINVSYVNSSWAQTAELSTTC
jgi:hypothetical protein